MDGRMAETVAWHKIDSNSAHCTRGSRTINVELLNRSLVCMAGPWMARSRVIAAISSVDRSSE
jgi:hypothetical protein